VSHSTLQRLVHRQEFEEPTTRCIRGEHRWRKSPPPFSNQGCGKLLAGLQSRSLTGYLLWYIFQSNLSLSDWVNSQRLLCPLVCLGDGHDGVWNLFEEIGTAIRQF